MSGRNHEAEARDSGRTGRVPEIGDVIASKYRVDQIIARGGMSVVLLVTHLTLDEPFVLKFLRADLADDPVLLRRFAGEAKACVKIKSEYVARVHDVGTHDDGTPFMVMEYLEGVDLRTELVERGPLPAEVVCDYAIQACAGLAEAHVLGIVHRDIKPENLFLLNRPDRRRTLKVLDFGISKGALGRNIVGADVRSHTTAKAVGTPHYMSPEQLRSTHIDPRSDIWNLGVVMYELLTGVLPFGGPTVTAVCAAILEQACPPIPVDLPGPLAEIVTRALEKDPERRFRHVADLALALVPFAPSYSRVAAAHAASLFRAIDVDVDASGTLESLRPPPGPQLVSPSGPRRAGPEAETLMSVPGPPPRETPRSTPERDGNPSSSGGASDERPRSPALIWAVAACIGLAGGVTFWLLSMRARPHEAPPATSSIPVETAAPPATAAAILPSSTAGEPTTTTTTTADPARSARATGPRRSAPPVAAPTAAARPSSPPEAAPPPPTAAPRPTPAPAPDDVGY